MTGRYAGTDEGSRVSPTDRHRPLYGERTVGIPSVRRPRKATAMADSAPTYQQLLDEAQELGRLDGRFAAAFEHPGAGVSAGRCLGRTPEQFARLLWEGRAGNPPSGLELNAPAWYAAGFAEGLTAGTRPPARALSLRRVFS
jgi:hypothetical protein